MKKDKSVKQKHSEWLQDRFCKERLEVIPYVATHRRGLNPEQVRQAVNASKGGALEVHMQQIGDGPGFSAVYPAGTEPGPSVLQVVPLDQVMDDYAVQRDLARAKRVAEADKQSPLQHFDGSSISEQATERHARQVRAAVFADARVLGKDVRAHGLPVIQPPSPSSNGKVSIEHAARYAQQQGEIDEILTLEAERLREFSKARHEAAAARAPEYTREQLDHVLRQLPAAQRAEVEAAIAGTPDVQANTFLVSRPILTADKQRSLGFSTRRFDTERGGRPTPEQLSREFGQPDARGIRIASIFELMADSRERLAQQATYGENSCAALPDHQRGLFLTPSDLSPTGRPAAAPGAPTVGSDGE